MRIEDEIGEQSTIDSFLPTQVNSYASLPSTITSESNCRSKSGKGYCHPLLLEQSGEESHREASPACRHEEARGDRAFHASGPEKEQTLRDRRHQRRSLRLGQKERDPHPGQRPDRGDRARDPGRQTQTRPGKPERSVNKTPTGRKPVGIFYAHCLIRLSALAAKCVPTLWNSCTSNTRTITAK